MPVASESMSIMNGSRSGVLIRIRWNRAAIRSNSISRCSPSRLGSITRPGFARSAASAESRWRSVASCDGGVHGRSSRRVPPRTRTSRNSINGDVPPPGPPSRSTSS